MTQSPSSEALNAPAAAEKERRRERWFARTPLDDLKRKSVRGGVVTMASQPLKFVLRTGATMILARLLTPEDFGIQTMVAALIGFLGLFRDVGLSAVTVQREQVTHAQLSTLFWINTGLGVGLWILLAAFSPLLAHFNHEPRLYWVAIVSGLSFFLNGLSVQHFALLQRQMRFVAMAAIEMLSLAASGLAGVIMALMGYGYWSLVGMLLVQPLVMAVGSWIAVPWMPGLPQRKVGMRSMLSFGGILTCNSLVVYLAYNTEKLLMGHYLGTQAIGLYGRAYQLINMPTEQLSSAISTVAFPSLSRLQNDAERVVRAFLRGYGLNLALTIPTMACCAIFSEEILAIFLGSQWTAAVPIFRLLSPTVLAFAFINPTAWFLIATGRLRRSLHLALLIAPTMIIAVSIGMRYGAEGVATAFSIAMMALVIPFLAWFKAGTGITGAGLWQAAYPPLIAGLAGATAAVALKYGVAFHWPLFVKLGLGVPLVYGVHFLILCYGFGQKDAYLDLFRQLFRKK